MDLDLEILLRLNRIVSTDTGHLIVDLLGNDAFVRGGPVFIAFLAIWFAKKDGDEQAAMLSGLIVTFAAVVISVELQFLITPHARPFLDPSLDIQTRIADMHLHRLSSFPSDTATLYSGICAIVFRERRLPGVWCAIWSFITAGLCRVMLGYHYPSDILAGMILGAGLVVLSAYVGFPKILITRTMRMFARPAIVINTMMFICMAEAYNQFLGFIVVLRTVKKLGNMLMGSTG